MTCYFCNFHCRRAPLLGHVCFWFFTEVAPRLWIGRVSAICVLHNKNNGISVFSVCANSTLLVDVFKIRHRFLDVFALFFHDFYGCSEVKISKRFWNRFSDGFWCGVGIDFAHLGGLEPQKVDPKAEVIPKVCPRLSEGASQAVGTQRNPAEPSANQRNPAEPSANRITPDR